MFLINALASALLAMLALSDLRQRRLPNAMVAGFAALYFAHAWSGGASRVEIETHLATGAAALVLAAKLCAAVFLWTDLPHATTVFFIVSFIGLMLAVAQLAWRLVERARAAVSDQGWLSPARGVPYGVALAAGGIAAVWLPRVAPHALRLQHAAWPLLSHARLT